MIILSSVPGDFYLAADWFMPFLGMPFALILVGTLAAITWKALAMIKGWF